MESHGGVYATNYNDVSGNLVDVSGNLMDVSGNLWFNPIENPTETTYTYISNDEYQIESYETDKLPLNDDDMFSLRKLPLSLELSRLEYTEKPQ
jgi:hypothetical protein